jgi:glycosyltransferase involved in cell wall biosynthesis
MDLKKNGRILYISSVDVSIGNGPGVNEREFIVAMHRVMGDRAYFLIPQPANEVPDLPANACTFCLPHRRHHPLHFPGHVISQARLANDILSRKKFDLLLFRLDVLPLVAFYITRKHRIPYAIKTLGQGTMNALAERGGWLGRSLVALNRWLVKQIVAKALLADSVSTMQVQHLKHLLSVDSDKIVWIDNAVNTSRFFPALSRRNVRSASPAAVPRLERPSTLGMRPATNRSCPQRQCPKGSAEFVRYARGAQPAE